MLTELCVQLVTHRKRNMANQLVPLADQLLLRKRAIIESIFDQLKNISQIEHTRHRSLGQLCCQPAGWPRCVLPSTEEALITLLGVVPFGGGYPELTLA